MRPLCALLCLVAFASTPAAQAPESAQDLARRLQQRYTGVRDFQADFTQIAVSGQLKRKVSYEGRVYVKKPGKMRWDYMRPEKQQSIWDGKTMYHYNPQDKAAYRGDLSADDGSSTALLFLAGQGDLLRDFTASLAPMPSPGTLALKLTPKKTDAYEFLVVLMDQKSLGWRGLTTLDRQGNEMQFQFRNLRENTGLNDSMFVFKPPSGVKISETLP